MPTFSLFLSVSTLQRKEVEVLQTQLHILYRIGKSSFSTSIPMILSLLRGLKHALDDHAFEEVVVSDVTFTLEVEAGVSNLRGPVQVFEVF